MGLPGTDHEPGERADPGHRDAQSRNERTDTQFDDTSATATLTISDWTFDFSIWVNATGTISAGNLPPGEDPPFPACAATTTWTRYDERSIATKTPCRIIAIGERQGSILIMASEPLRFATDQQEDRPGAR